MSGVSRYSFALVGDMGIGRKVMYWIQFRGGDMWGGLYCKHQVCMPKPWSLLWSI